jgi:2-haloacid dehalogenase
VEPCLKQKIPVIWVNRHGDPVEGKKPDADVKTFREAGKLLKAA